MLYKEIILQLNDYEKIKLLIAAILAIPSVVSAQSPIFDGTSNPETGLTSTYWGTEASTNPNNPCKGATTRKCAVIETDIVNSAGGTSYVVTTVKNGNGRVISVERNVVQAPAQVYIQEQIMNLPANAEISLAE